MVYGVFSAKSPTYPKDIRKLDFSLRITINRMVDLLKNQNFAVSEIDRIFASEIIKR